MLKPVTGSGAAPYARPFSRFESHFGCIRCASVPSDGVPRCTGLRPSWCRTAHIPDRMHPMWAAPVCRDTPEVEERETTETNDKRQMTDETKRPGSFRNPGLCGNRVDGCGALRRRTSRTRTWAGLTETHQSGAMRHARIPSAQAHARAGQAAWGVGDRVSVHVGTSRVDGSR